MSLKVYLAASFSRQAEMRRLRRRLKQYGIVVTSHWLEEHSCPRSMSQERFMRAMALIDLHDILKADVFVRFTDPQVVIGQFDGVVPASLATGSRMFETCYAYEHRKPVVVVGGHQQVFDYLPKIIHVNDVEVLISYLKERSKTWQS